jgi:uncharacterized protein
MTAVVLLSIGIVALVMLAMAVGAIFSNRCLRGSCGGPEVLGAGGEALSCGACPRRRGDDPTPPGDAVPLARR